MFGAKSVLSTALVNLASNLKHPHFVGLSGDGSNVNDASGQLDQERHVVGDQPTKRADFDGEEVVDVPRASARDR